MLRACHGSYHLGVIHGQSPGLLHRPPSLRHDHACGRSRNYHHCTRGAFGRDVSPEPEGTGELLASEFSKFVSNSGLNESMRYKRPTPMIAPHLAVQSIMTALQMNDYPEEDAGAHTAYLFSKPYDCENLIAGQGTPASVRSWLAHEAWLKPKDFSQMLHETPFDVLLDCHEWKASSAVVFPSQRMGNKALQAIQVKGNASRTQPFTFTFCLERIETGPYKGCWLIVGLREGDYASVT